MVYGIINVVLLTDVFFIYVITLRDGELQTNRRLTQSFYVGQVRSCVKASDIYEWRLLVTLCVCSIIFDFTASTFTVP